jgi:hypothetical protein
MQMEYGGLILTDPAAIIRALVATVQAHMDAAARAFGYDSLASAVSYADEPVVAQFQHEGQAFRRWRSLVWAAAYARLAAGGPLPTPEEALALLPSLTFTEAP